MVLDLRVWNDGTTYAEEGQTVLPGVQFYDIDCYRGHDMSRWIAAQRERGGATKTNDEPSARVETPPQAPKPSQNRETVTELKQNAPIAVRPYLPNEPRGVEVRQSQDVEAPAGGTMPSEPPLLQLDEKGEPELGRDSESAFYYSEWDSNDACEVPERWDGSSTASFIGIDAFRLDQDDRQDVLLPVVKVWLDIGAHFKEEDIPSPVDFLRQRDELLRIIAESRARTGARTTADCPNERSAARGNDLFLKFGRSSGSSAGRRRQSKQGERDRRPRARLPGDLSSCLVEGFWSKLGCASRAALCMR
ncbi:hypothetical protein C8Q77DRAFT_1140814 [Trametes polyzona]|nr:hypothetical protein C8Q77DRAFT_1140814 [Trametes polyzona]